MEFHEYLKKTLMNYFIIVTGITVAMATLGLIYEPEVTFGYEAYFSPLIFGAIAVLPSFLLYSKRDLTMKQMLVRRILHFTVLELVLLGFGYITNLFQELEVALSFALSVLMVYLFTSMASWLIDTRTAVEINKGLKRLQR